jgi:hypothetical protein
MKCPNLSSKKSVKSSLRLGVLCKRYNQFRKKFRQLLREEMEELLVLALAVEQLVLEVEVLEVEVMVEAFLEVLERLPEEVMVEEVMVELVVVVMEVFLLVVVENLKVIRNLLDIYNV